MQNHLSLNSATIRDNKQETSGYGTAERLTNEAGKKSEKSFCRSDGEDAIRSLCSLVDGFDQSNTAPALYTVRSTGPFILNGRKKILENGLVAADIADGSRRRALVFIRWVGFSGVGWSVSEIGRDNAIVFENNRAFRPGNLHTAWVARVRGSGGVKNTQGSAGKLERRHGRIFGLDFMQQRSGARLHVNDITKQPEQQIDCVDALIDQRTAAVESNCPAPVRIGVVLRRAIPLHARVHE